MSKKFYLDLIERVLWTFVQGFAAAWIVLPEFTADVFYVALVAGAVAVAKCLIATQIGAPNTASTLPLEEDTERGHGNPDTVMWIVIVILVVLVLLALTGNL